MADTHLQLLPAAWEPTRSALQRVSRAISAVPRVHASADPHWSHIALEVQPGGLSTVPVRLPGGGEVRVVLDVVGAEVRVERGLEIHRRIPLTGVSSVATQVFGAAAELGLPGPYDATHTSDDASAIVDPDHARAFWQLLGEVDALFRRQRATLPGTSGQVKLWPHGFDISFEWFGSKRDSAGTPAQLNLGWYPTGDAYFYSNPWPFDERLLASPLPAGAEWHTEEWKGTMLPQAAIAGASNAAERVLEYAAAVFDLARPTLDL